MGRYAAPAEPGESMAESQARERVTLLGDEGVGWRLVVWVSVVGRCAVVNHCEES